MKTTPASAAEALDRSRGLARAAWSRLQRDDLGDEANAAAQREYAQAREDLPAADMLDPRRPAAARHAGRVPVGARGGRAQVSRVGGSRAGAGVRWGPLAGHVAAAGRL